MARLFGKDASIGLVTELSPILITNFTTFYYSVAIPHYWGQVTKSDEGIGEPEVFVSCRHSFGRESLENRSCVGVQVPSQAWHRLALD